MVKNHPISSVSEEPSDILSLLEIANSIKKDPFHSFTFNFSKCQFLGCTAIAILGAIANFVDSRFPKPVNERQKLLYLAVRTHSQSTQFKTGVNFDVTSMPDNLKNRLIANNFLSYFEHNYTKYYPNGKYIGFRMHPKMDDLDEEELYRHISEEWLTPEKVLLSDKLKTDLVSKIIEIFINAFGHGINKTNEPDLNVVSCGDYRQNEQKLLLSIVDFGDGIANHVRNYLGNNISDSNALLWALTEGNSTKTDSIRENIPRGLGLSLLRAFIYKNKGSLDIYTNSCHAYIDSNGNYKVDSTHGTFEGTIITISINCRNDVKYSYTTEG